MKLKLSLGRLHPARLCSVKVKRKFPPRNPSTPVQKQSTEERSTSQPVKDSMDVYQALMKSPIHLDQVVVKACSQPVTPESPRVEFCGNKYFTPKKLGFSTPLKDQSPCESLSSVAEDLVESDHDTLFSSASSSEFEYQSNSESEEEYLDEHQEAILSSVERDCKILFGNNEETPITAHDEEGVSQLSNSNSVKVQIAASPATPQKHEAVLSPEQQADLAAAVSSPIVEQKVLNLAPTMEECVDSSSPLEPMEQFRRLLQTNREELTLKQQQLLENIRIKRGSWTTSDERIENLHAELAIIRDSGLVSLMSYYFEELFKGNRIPLEA